MKIEEIEKVQEYFEKANSELEKLKLFTSEFSIMIEEEYNNYNLFFLRSFLDLVKSEENQDCIQVKIEKLNKLWKVANKSFEEYIKSE